MKSRTALGLFALALGLRVLYAAFATTQPDMGAGLPTYDLNYAQKIISGVEWITTPYSPKAPGYPVVLALLLVLSLKQTWLVLFLHTALGALTVVVLFRLAQEVMGRTMAIIAAVWFAGSVHHMQYSALLTRDMVTVLLLVLLLYLLARPFRKMMRFGAFAGLVYAALIHVDPQFILLFPLFAVFILFFKSRYRILNVQYFFVCVVAIVAFSVPWMIRNAFVYRQAVPIALEASRYVRPFKVFLSDHDTAVADIEERVSHASRTRRLQTNALEFWRVARLRDGTAYESQEIGNARPTEPAWSLRHNLISVFSYGLLLPFFALGILVAFRSRNRTVLMLIATIAAYFMLRAYLGGNERVRLPADPFIVVVAFYGIEALVRRGSKRQEEPAGHSE